MAEESKTQNNPKISVLFPDCSSKIRPPLLSLYFYCKYKCYLFILRYKADAVNV